VLATATHARRLGAQTIAVRWPHDMHPASERVARRAAELATIHRAPNAAIGLAWVALLRLTSGARWIPIGGSSPLGALGHVNAALELSEQIARGELPMPARVVVPLGSAGTAAGLALGFAIAGLETTVLGARVGPRLAATRGRVLRLARGARSLIRRLSGADCPAVDPRRVAVVHDVYGGAYGRPLAAGERAAAELRTIGGPLLDATYSAKAFAAALGVARRQADPTLFWLTFDSRAIAEQP
jgi:D-cysteine desulfhydrase